MIIFKSVLLSAAIGIAVPSFVDGAQTNLRVNSDDNRQLGHNKHALFFVDDSSESSKADGQSYEIWASDQSNSVSDQSSLGVAGSFLWIFDSDGVKGQLEGDGEATPLPCSPGATVGPCDIMDMFPGELVDQNGKSLAELGQFGRLHGVIKVSKTCKHVR